MKLFTKEIDKKLFQQYPYGSDLASQKVVAKIFNPYGRGTWYLLNSDPADPDYLWAIVDLFEVEIGSVSRTELESIKVKPFGLGLERDLYFSPINAMELYEGLQSGKRYANGGISDVEVIEKNNEAYLGMPQLGKGSTMVKLEHGGNLDMLKNQAVQFKHHAEELHNVLKSNPNVDAWVVAKAERASTDLSDITHYLEGSEKMANGGQLSMFEQGGGTFSNKIIYTHKYIPTMTLEVLDYTNKGVKGLQKDSKSLSKKERSNGIIVYYSDAEIKDLWQKKFADGGNILSEDTVARVDDPAFADVGMYASGGVIKEVNGNTEVTVGNWIFYFDGEGENSILKEIYHKPTDLNAEFDTTYIHKLGTLKGLPENRIILMFTHPTLGDFQLRGGLNIKKEIYTYTDGSVFAKGGQITNGSLVRVKKYGWIMRVDKIEGNMYYLENDRRGTMNGNAGSYLASDIELVMSEGGEITLGLGQPVTYRGELYEITQKDGVTHLTLNKEGAWGIDYPMIPLSMVNQNELRNIHGQKVYIPYTFDTYSKGGGVDEVDESTLYEWAKNIDDESLLSWCGYKNKYDFENSSDLTYNKRNLILTNFEDLEYVYNNQAEYGLTNTGKVGDKEYKRVTSGELLDSYYEGSLGDRYVEVYNKNGQIYFVKYGKENNDEQNYDLLKLSKKEAIDKGWLDHKEKGGGIGEYAKGGGVSLSERQKDTLYNSWVNAKNKLVDLAEDLKKAKIRNDKDDIIEINKRIKRTKLSVSSFEKMMNENNINYAKGGRAETSSFNLVKNYLDKNNFKYIVKQSPYVKGMYSFKVDDKTFDLRDSGKIEKLHKGINVSSSTNSNVWIIHLPSSDWSNYSKGGKTTFKDKVASIKAKLLKNKKVPKAVQKDYGKTFSPAEAEDSAKRIAGAMRKKEMAKKYENGGEVNIESGKNFHAIGKSKTKSNRFNTYSYLLSIDKSHPKLIKGQKLTYGYLQGYTGKIGTPRGWFIAEISVDKDDFDKFWELENMFVINAKTDKTTPFKK